MVDEYEDILENVETLIEDDSKFPVVEDGKIKLLCKMILGFIKFVINFLMNSNKKDATKKKT